MNVFDYERRPGAKCQQDRLPGDKSENIKAMKVSTTNPKVFRVFFKITQTLA
jgi:hypothetical protein